MREKVTIAHLAHLWRGGGYTYYWTDNGRQSYWFTTNNPSCVPDGWKNNNVYFGIHPCAEIPKTNASGEPKPPGQVRAQIRLISAINCLFGEYDAKDEVRLNEYAVYLPDNFDSLIPIAQKTAVKTAKERAVSVDRSPYKLRAMARIQTAPLAPSLIIDSGGGYHAYWFLTDTVRVTDANRDHIQSIQGAWVDLIGCDAVSKDITRVLRVPGTKNVKPHYAPDYPVVAVVEHEPSRLFNLTDFERLLTLDDVGLAANKAATTTRQNDKSSPHNDVIAEFNRTHKIVDLLTARGYVLGWERSNVARLARPGRAKDQTSVIVFKDGDKEMSYHHSSSDDLYTAGHCRDAFDIETYFEHKGNAKLAFEAAKRAQGKWTEPQPKQIIDPLTGEITTLLKTPIRPTQNGNHPSPMIENTETESEPASIPDHIQSDLDALAYRAEDGGILDAWLEYYGDDWLFVVGPDKWHWWAGSHWMIDEKLIVQSQIESLMDAMNKQCSGFINDAPGKIKTISEKYAKADLDIPEAAIREIERIKTRYEIAKTMHKATKRSSARISSVEIMARAKRGQSVNQMDTNESINLKNGVFNLRSLELLPHNRDDMFTYCLDYEYDPAADCPQFKKFISEVLVKDGTIETDWSLVKLFQELLGYSLTPHVKREVMVWMFGEGGNGKSVAISVIEGLLGPMSMSIDFQTVGMPGNYDLADIPGKRVLFSTEAERNKFMAEGYIKRIVTGDTINTRPIYGSTIRFKSTAKIWWSMNDKPLIRDTTDSMWRRMKLIPFLRKFEEGKNADPELTAKLLAELSGILNWALDGLVRLKVDGKFTHSDAADEAKRQYREEANPVAQWLNTQTIRTSGPNTLQGALFRNYMEWCGQQNEKPISSTQFSKDLKRLKVLSERKAAGQMYFLAIIEPHERQNT